jgi:PAT family beta-lactamase induction signal transducer AmpG
VRTRTKLLWVGLLYLAQGFPFGVFQECVPVYLRVHGIGLREIGLLSLLGLPWSLKVLWSPLVDRYLRFQTWIFWALAMMGLLLILMPAVETVPPSMVLWSLLLLFAVASATQDVAIDGYTITLLDPHEIGLANGIRVTAYRIALIIGGGGIVALAASVSWAVLFACAAIFLVVLAPLAWRAPRVSRDLRARRHAIGGLLPWVRRPAAGAVLLFVLTYKLGDAAMAPMVKPFWVDTGMSLVEIGMISTTLGIAATIIGALAGGYLTSRIGIFRGLWMLGLLQAVSNLIYAGVAASDIGRGGIYFASLFESFSGGLGTAAFLAFLMSICEKAHAATQYALLSALFGFTRSIAGGFSGWGAENLGYASYFAVTFLLALPAYALLPWVSRYLRAGAGSGDSA